MSTRVFAGRPAGAPVPLVGAPVAELADVRFSYAPGAPPALSVSALRVLPGERLFVEGPSGSGKSTLLGLLGGVAVPQHGSVQVLGQDLHRLSAGARDRLRADHVGVIFQMFNLVPYLSIEENAALPCGFSLRRKQRAEQAHGSVADATRYLLAALGLGDPALRRRPVTQLSIGQQQRVAAARALIGAPELIVADEPTSALDSDHRDAFLELLFRECAAAGSTLVLVSHDRTLAARFGRVLRLRDGQVDGVSG